MRDRSCLRLPLPLVLVAAAALVACNRGDNEYKPPPPPSVHVSQPLKRSVTEYFELTGNTAAINSVDIEARVQGFLETIDYHDGSPVKAGTQLFSIQSNTYVAQRDQAQAMLASSQAAQVGRQQEYDRQLNLMKQQVTTQTNVDAAKAQLDQANANILNSQASLQLAEINLGYTKVLAPFDGIVTKHLVDVGALVGVSGPTQLATIVQVDPIYVYFNVSEPQVLAIKQQLAKQGKSMRDVDLPSVPVEIGLQSEEGYPHKGHLDYAAPQVDAATGTLQVRGVLDNQNRALLPGFFARVRVPVGHLDNAVLVRNDALGTNQQGNYLLMLGKDNVVEQRQVKTGERDGPLRVIVDGLEPGDWVVTEGVQRAIPGATVAPEQVAMDAGLTLAPQPATPPVTPQTTPAPAKATSP
jgi:multidrug efflux system membrane fusion protein